MKHHMMNFVESSRGIGSLELPTIIYEDNVVCITQIQTGYKEQHYNVYCFEIIQLGELQRNEKLNILQMKPCDDLNELFTKSLPNSLFQKHMLMELVQDDFVICKVHRSALLNFDLFNILRSLILHAFPLRVFFQDGISYKIFNKAVIIQIF